jgi:hypothetical protein
MTRREEIARRFSEYQTVYGVLTDDDREFFKEVSAILTLPPLPVEPGEAKDFAERLLFLDGKISPSGAKGLCAEASAFITAQAAEIAHLTPYVEAFRREERRADNAERDRDEARKEAYLNADNRNDWRERAETAESSLKVVHESHDWLFKEKARLERKLAEVTAALTPSGAVVAFELGAESMYDTLAKDPAPAPTEGGWVLVPRDPTDEMVRQGSVARAGMGDKSGAENTTLTYRAMLTAAPAPAQGEPVAWRVRVRSPDHEEWTLVPAGAGADYLWRRDYDVQPLYISAPFSERVKAEREACAKIADDHTPRKHAGTLSSHVTGSTIAAAIRARSEP